MNEEILRILKSADGFVSGEEIGKKLNVSRTAVWKAVIKLKEAGYSIESINNRGYKLIDNADIINSAEIRQNLKADFMGCKIVCCDTVDSTNNYARKLALDGAPEGTVVTAEIQKSGKGRRGKNWFSQKGSGAWFSFIMRPAVLPVNAPAITLAAGLAVCRAIINITGLEAKIKWPNDITINGKKVCGILAEMSAEMERVNFIIVGIGVNVNTEKFPDELDTVATSLKIESGIKYRRANVISEILNEFEKLYIMYNGWGGIDGFKKDYCSLCETIGSYVTVLGKYDFEAKAIEIDDRGELIVEIEGGKRVTVSSGEVSIRRKL